MMDALQNKIAAIEADPLAWAKAAEEKFLATLGSGGWDAKESSEEEHLAYAAKELAHAKELLAEEGEPEKSEPVDMDRLMRANARARRAVGNLQS